MVGMRTIDRSSDRPAYRQLADILREQITSGQLVAGAELPAEGQLAESYGISRNSVKQAIQLLRTEGLVFSTRGRLTRVRPIRVIGERRYSIGKRNYGEDRESAFAREHGVPWSEFEITREYRIVPAPPRVAAALHIPEGSEVYERQFTHATGGVVLRLSHSYLEATRFADTVLTNPDEPLWPGGTVAQLSSIGIDVTRVRAEVTARMATPQEAETLKLGTGVPVLEAWRTQVAGDEAVETACHIYPPNGQILVFDIPVGPPPPGNEWYGKSYD